MTESLSISQIALEGQRAARDESGAWTVVEHPNYVVVHDLLRGVPMANRETALKERVDFINRRFDTRAEAQQYVLMRAWIAATEKILSMAGVPVGIEHDA